MPMTIRITAEITDATTANYYDYLGRDLLANRVKADVAEALDTALDAIRDGAESITTPIRNDGRKVGTLTVTEE